MNKPTERIKREFVSDKPDIMKVEVTNPRPNRKATLVVNIKGDPYKIEELVNSYLKKGYELNSKILPWETSTGEKLFVQQLVLYED